MTKTAAAKIIRRLSAKSTLNGRESFQLDLAKSVLGIK